MSIMNCLNLGCKLASFLSRLAMGLQMVLRARVPNFTTGRIISPSSFFATDYVAVDSLSFSSHEFGKTCVRVMKLWGKGGAEKSTVTCGGGLREGCSFWLLP